MVILVMQRNSIHLDVTAYRQTKNNTCVPSCCKMVLDYVNKLVLTNPEQNFSEDEIAEIMKTSISGTLFSEIENMNEVMTTSTPSLEFSAEFEAHTLSDIKSELDLGLPLSVWIVINYGGNDYSHSVVITGIDETEKTISYNDPTFGDEYTTSQSEFMSMWESNGTRMIKTKIGRIISESLEKYMPPESNNEQS